jgi:hypothetical protein
MKLKIYDKTSWYLKNTGTATTAYCLSEIIVDKFFYNNIAVFKR